MRKIGRVYVPVALAVAASLAVLTGCTDPTPCAGVGVVSELGVYVVQEDFGGLEGASYELCSRGDCVEGELGGESVSRVFLSLPDDVDPDTAPVRLTVTRAGAGTPLVDDSVDVKLLRQSDGCGGGGWSRGLALTKADGLLPNVPKRVSAAWMRQVRAAATASPSPSSPPSPTSRTASGTPTG
ncbi:hypothetical protein [Streptomyces sp. S3(2020)]|uniref:hypothetical protein n=1 Tax=Streptomyces sp. S3(2020) TaxID=2732044 RepID=UPI0019D2B56D|nr:hypothetical protein [Streptomyces sp. S3(2020)]